MKVLPLEVAPHPHFVVPIARTVNFYRAVLSAYDGKFFLKVLNFFL
jgi:hypothetical protein